MTNKVDIALEIMGLFREYDCNAYLVGGSIRNLLLNIPIKDIDLATDCSPEKVESIALTNNINFIPTGVEHGTGTIIYKDNQIEITTFRIDKQCYGRKADVEFGCTLEQDLSRRDFTINSMAMDINGNIIDPFNGKEDLINRLIKAVGDPDKRFEEDQLRTLRAIRFATVLDFYIDPETFNAIKRVKLNRIGIILHFDPETLAYTKQTKLSVVSNERIRDELSKILESPNRSRGLALLDESGLLIQILPEISNLKGVLQDERYHPEKDTFIHTLLAIKSLPPDASLALVLATLLHDVGKPATRTEEDNEKEGKKIHFYGHEDVGKEISERVLRNLKFPLDIIEEVKWLVGNHMRIHEFSNMRKSKQIRLVQEPYFSNLLELLKADVMGSSALNGVPLNLGVLDYIDNFIIENEEQIKRVQILITKERLITGFDIINLGINPKKHGKLIGLILDTIEDEILEERIKTRKNALNFAKELIGQIKHEYHGK
jgi:putative nucleotidyltransferase with HDIG domain